jgi:ADP-ribose pyrophosphatase YjhB (NUDIX family)
MHIGTHAWLYGKTRPRTSSFRNWSSWLSFAKIESIPPLNLSFPFSLSHPFVKRHFTATAFIIDSNKRTLLLWHKRLKRWMPAGGHVDENETPEDAAKRECKEETNLDVQIIGDPYTHFYARVVKW